MKFQRSLSLKSRFLLLLLPAFFACIFGFSTLLYLKWQTAITKNFQSKLSSVVSTGAELLSKEELENLLLQDKGSSELLKKLEKTARAHDLEQLFLIKNEDELKELFKKLPAQFESFHAFIQKLKRKPFLIVSPLDESGEKNVLRALSLIDGQERIEDTYFVADLSLKKIQAEESKAFLFLLFSSLSCFSLIALALFFVAHKMTRQIQNIKNAALSIAGGNYERNVEALGALEIVELANTLNTMSACLKEKMEQIKQSSVLKEQMYGEKECATLFQERMLEHAIDKSPKPLEKMSLYATTPSASYLKVKQNTLSFLQNKQKGFSAMIDLLQERGKDCPFLHLELAKDCLNARVSQMPHPLIWKAAEKSLHSFEQTKTENGDFVFFYTSSLEKIFEHTFIVKSLEQVLCHFSNEGAHICLEMLEKKWSFSLKKQILEEDLHLFCLSC